MTRRAPATRVRAAWVTVVMAVLTWLVIGMAPSASAALSLDKVNELQVSYDLQADGSVKVSEHYWYQFNVTGRHGIIRYVTTQQGYDANNTQTRLYDISDITVSSPTGAPDTLDVTQSGGATVLRIGSASQTVPTGVQEYVVNYTLSNVVNKQTDGVEFYWNVLGDGWRVAFDKVSVKVTAPQPITKTACYMGAVRTNEPCASATPGNPATFTSGPISAGGDLTIVNLVPAAAFTDTEPQVVSGTPEDNGYTGDYVSPQTAQAQTYGALGVAAGAPLLALATMGGLAWSRGRDERYVGLAPDTVPAPGEQVATRRGGRRPAVAVRFNPPDNAPPGLVGTIIDESADTIDVSATVLDLAVRGYLRIEQVESGFLGRGTDYLMTALQPPAHDKGLLPYERTVLDGIFALGTPVHMSELRNTFAGTLRIAKSQIYTETVSRGWFRRSPDAVRSSFNWIFVLPFVLFFGWMFLGGGSLLTADSVAGVSLPIPSLFLAVLGLLLAAGIIAFFARRMPSRTGTGSAVLEQSRGFKEYLVTAEARQIAYDEALNIFSRYLPYAVVFGVADRWAKTFSEVAAAARADGIDIGMPTFFIFPGGGWGGFEDFGHTVDDWGTMSAGTFMSTPGSSGGSGFGGGGFDGGGGFSGGGGGGGGGGSW